MWSKALRPQAVADPAKLRGGEIFEANFFFSVSAVTYKKYVCDILDLFDVASLGVTLRKYSKNVPSRRRCEDF